MKAKNKRAGCSGRFSCSGWLRLGAALLSTAVFLFFIASCNPHSNQIRRMQQLEEGVSNPTSIEELEDAIKKYSARVEDVINAEIRIASWYKILGTRYLDNKMYGKALENFQAAVEYYPANQNLFYYIGVCAGYMSKAALDYSASGSHTMRDRYVDLAESAYIRAIELEPRYVRALYGLSVVYIFEKNEPEKAVPLLELVNEIEKRNFDALMLLANAYWSTGEFEKASETYDRVIGETKDEERRAIAESYKAAVLQEMYDGAY